jgi:predicted permease
MMETLIQDVRYGLRMLRKSPAFTFVAVLSLGLGIGANTTIFTLVNAVLLHSEPVKEMDRLVAVYTTDVKNQGNFFAFMPVSRPNFLDYRDQNDVFEGMAAAGGTAVSLSGSGEPEQLFAALVTGNYFSLLGVPMQLGRGFLPDEDITPGTHPVVVLSDGLWKRRFAANEGIIGKTLTLNNGIFTVVGVTPPGFTGLNALGGPDLYVPTMMHEQLLTGFLAENFDNRRALLFNPFGRLKGGVSMAQAGAALKSIGTRLEKDYPEPNKGRNVGVIPLAQTTINPNIRGGFVLAGGVLMCVVAIVLLIACANVANLLMARAAARRKEIAVRLSLGAGRARLVRQLLTESLVLALLSGGVGILIAYWARDLLMVFRPPQLIGAVNLPLDGRVLLFTLAASIVTGLLFGLLPAFQASRPDLAVELKDRSGVAGHHKGRLRLKGALVIVQVALSLVSLIGAGLFLRSLRNAQAINPGFEAGNLLTVSFDLGGQRMDAVHGGQFHRQVLEKVRSLPGVKLAALSSNLPIGGGFGRTVFPEGQPIGSGAVGQFTNVNTVGVGYFSTLGIPIKRGRDFSEADREMAPMVIVINEAMAATFWPGQDALGKRFKFFGDEEYREVIGIAQNTKVFTLGEDPQPVAYIPLLQQYEPAITLNVRTSVDAAGLLPVVRREVQALQPSMPLTNVQTTDELIAQILFAPKMGAALLAVFGVLALVLAAIGIYGVMSYSVNERTGEFGLRMALGAQPADILSLVLRQGMILWGAGLGIGLLASLLASRFLATLLFNTHPNDPLTFAGISLLLALVSVMAGYLPARRATKSDPMIALRYE